MNCELCGMSYVPEIPDNVRQHKIYHDKVVNGVSVPPSENDNVVWEQGDLQMIVVNRESPSEQLRQAEEVGRFARMDTSYGAEVIFGELEVRLFLLRKQDRIVGFLLLDKRDHVWQTSWVDLDKGNEPREILDHSPMWSICMIWILKRHRRSGWALTMIDKALAYLGCTFETVGWYTPFTDSGEALVRNCCQNTFYIAK